MFGNGKLTLKILEQKENIRFQKKLTIKKFLILQKKTTLKKSEQVKKFDISENPKFEKTLNK